MTAPHGHLIARVLAAALLLAVIAACTPSPSGDTFTLTVTVEGDGTGTVTSVPAGIDVTSGDAPDTLVVADGTTVTLTADADPGSTFAGWTGACDGTDPCVVDMNADAEVTATFTLDAVVTTRTLTVTIDGDGTGTVMSVPAGIDVTSGDEPDSHVFADGTTVTLTAVAADGSTFAGWTGASCPGTAPCEVDMDADVDVTATFDVTPVAPTHTLTVTVDGGGTGTVMSVPAGIDITSGDEPDSHDFAAGESVTLTALEEAGSTFAGWGGNCAAYATATCVLTMDTDADVTATFTPILDTFTLIVTVDGTGTGTVTSEPPGIDVTSGEAPDSHDFTDGTEVTLTAAPAADMAFTGWGGDCAGSATDKCVLTMDTDADVTATFDPVVKVMLTVDVVAGGAAAGSVTSDPPGIDTAASEFSESFNENSFVTLTAVTDETTPAGAFSGWVGGGCDDVRIPECTVTMDVAKDVTATFNQIQQLTVRPTANSHDGVEFLGDSVEGQNRTPPQWFEGWVWVNSAYADLGWAPYHNLTEAAFRFPGVTVPVGATVHSAVLQVTAAAPEAVAFPTTGAMSLTIEGEKSLTPAVLVQPAVTATTFDITTRDRTDASVVWNIAEDWVAGDVRLAPDASVILQEIIDQTGWTSGNPVMLMLKGGSVGTYRRVHTRDSGAPTTNHPTLLIEYVVKPPLP